MIFKPANVFLRPNPSRPVRGSRTLRCATSGKDPPPQPLKSLRHQATVKNLVQELERVRGRGAPLARFQAHRLLEISVSAHAFFVVAHQLGAFFEGELFFLHGAFDLLAELGDEFLAGKLDVGEDLANGVAADRPMASPMAGR